MGNIVPTKPSLSLNSSEDASITAILPAYYQPEVTFQDIQICSNIWIQIIDDRLPAPSSATPGYHSMRHWFYSELYSQITQEIRSNDLKHDCHLFLEGILELIPISFHQFQNRTHFQNHFQFFAKSCSEIGITVTIFNLFGSYLFSLIPLIDPQPEGEVSWIKLYSSILAVVLPILVHYRPADTVPAAVSISAPTGHSHPLVIASSSSLTTAPSNLPPPPRPTSLTLNHHAAPFLPTRSSERFYTSMENIVL
jgi:hypothetical protein